MSRLTNDGSLREVLAFTVSVKEVNDHAHFPARLFWTKGRFLIGFASARICEYGTRFLGDKTRTSFSLIHT